MNTTTTEIEPEEPDCTRGEVHEWCSPHSVLGGCAENPGVQGHGGGVVITKICRHCGTYRVTDTWAQDPVTGEQGLRSVGYREADEDSLAYVLRCRLRELWDALPDDETTVAAFDRAAEERLGLPSGYRWRDITPEGIRPVLRDLDAVDRIVDAVTEAVEEANDRPAGVETVEEGAP